MNPDDRDTTTLSERSRQRRERMVANRTSSFEEAERWDLEFWQSQSPQQRLSALVAIHREVALVEASRTATRDEKKSD